MANENENLDSLNQEHGEVKVEETDDAEIIKEKFNKVSEINKKVSDANRQLFARAKKAEGFELGSDGKWVKIQKPEPKSEVKPEPKPSNEPDYGRLAYLQSRNVTHPDDIKIVQEEAERLKLPLTDILNMEHIKNKLKTNNEARDAQNGMPSGHPRGGGATQQDVDYWLAKGGLPEDDQALAEKVVEARMGKDSSQRKFDPIR